MENIVILFGVISVFGLLLEGLFAFMDWKEVNHRTFFFVRWYLDWNRKEGEKRRKEAHKKTRK
jgi:hypothetical protein